MATSVHEAKCSKDRRNGWQIASRDALLTRFLYKLWQKSRFVVPVQYIRSRVTRTRYRTSPLPGARCLKASILPLTDSSCQHQSYNPALFESRVCNFIFLMTARCLEVVAQAPCRAHRLALTVRLQLSETVCYRIENLMMRRVKKPWFE